MSGGRFCYVDSQLKSEIFGWADKPRNVFEDREISELVWDVLDLIHEYDWYESGDTGKDDYLKAKRKFKNKWFGDSSKRQKKIIDEAIADLKKELYETWDVSDNDRCCKNCEFSGSCSIEEYGDIKQNDFCSKWKRIDSKENQC